MFSCMGSQLDMGDRDSERKALRKVHCTTQQRYKNEAHTNVIITLQSLKCYEGGCTVHE